MSCTEGSPRAGADATGALKTRFSQLGLATFYRLSRRRAVPCSHVFPELRSRDMRSFFEPLVLLGYRVVAPDLVGFGRSPGTREPAANESRHGAGGGALEVLEDVLIAFGWRPTVAKAKLGEKPTVSRANDRLDILGYSTGAAIALSFALRHHDGGSGGSDGGGGRRRRSASPSRPEHSAPVEVVRRIGTLALVNPVYRSGLNDAGLVRGNREPATSSTTKAVHVYVPMLEMRPSQRLN